MTRVCTYILTQLLIEKREMTGKLEMADVPVYISVKTFMKDLFSRLTPKWPVSIGVYQFMDLTELHKNSNSIFR